MVTFEWKMFEIHVILDIDMTICIYPTKEKIDKIMLHTHNYKANNFSLSMHMSNDDAI